MRERARKLLWEDRAATRPAFEPFIPPFVSTFHSLGLQIIKENAKLLGYKRTPAIYDRADSMRAIKEALKSVGTEDIEPRMALSVISRNKGEGSSAIFAERRKPRERVHRARVAKVRKRFARGWGAGL
jgi:superfamily I DNA/RNA helicase